MKKDKLISIITNKGIILSTIAIIMSLSLTGCGSNNVDDNNEVSQNQEIQNEENEASEDKEENKLDKDKVTEGSISNQNNNSTNSNAVESKPQVNTNVNTNTNTGGNTNSETQVEEGLTNLSYTSNNLGITFNVPDSWKGKYNVIEEDGKVSVYMKHKDNNRGIGLLFIIKNQGVDEDEVLNNIDGIESVDVNGQTLIVGGPTGYCMEDGDSLVPTYNRMVGECIYPVNSIKAK